ncbi:MAG: hypothetical protein IPH35_04660 [Rhodoferax sp.]|nr:hypothetical protein [Rhodoferax sp.]
MADSYHSDTYTVPFDAASPPLPRNEEKLRALEAIWQARAVAEFDVARKLDPGWAGVRFLDAHTTCLWFTASSRGGMAADSVDRLVQCRKNNRSLGFLGYDQFDLRFENLAWGVGLVTVLDDIKKIEAAAFELRSLLAWCETVAGASAAAEAIKWSGRSAEGVLRMVRESADFRYWDEFDDPNGDGYMFFYLRAMLTTLEFASRTRSSVIHTQMLPK